MGVPSVCDIALLQQHIGLAKAKEVILTGDRYPVGELAPYGLLNAVVPAEQLMSELFEVWQKHGLTASIDMSVDVFAGVFASTETHEQIERPRRAIGRRRRTDEAGLV